MSLQIALYRQAYFTFDVLFTQEIYHSLNKEGRPQNKMVFWYKTRLHYDRAPDFKGDGLLEANEQVA